jgi:GT2 family glycosyltransferase
VNISNHKSNWGVEKLRARHSIQVQVVIYENNQESLVHGAEFMIAAIKFARLNGVLGEATLTFGDCSTKQMLSEIAIEQLRALCLREEIDFLYSHFERNLGSAGGHNRLAELGDSSLILISNPDVVVQPDAIFELVSKLTADDRIGVAEAKQLPLEHPKEFNRETLDTSWCSMAFALTQRKLFEDINGFDSDNFFLYCDDVDFSWRARLEGYRTIYVPSAIIFHDKKLDSTARWISTPVEDYYSAEAALLLTYKWSRTDLTNSIAEIFSKSELPIYKKALEAFSLREKNHSLPIQVDPKNNVGTFVKGNFAKHRF